MVLKQQPRRAAAEEVQADVDRAAVGQGVVGGSPPAAKRVHQVKETAQEQVGPP